jgi:hypothetical protein
MGARLSLAMSYRNPVEYSGKWAWMSPTALQTRRWTFALYALDARGRQSAPATAQVAWRGFERAGPEARARRTRSPCSMCWLSV